MALRHAIDDRELLPDAIETGQRIQQPNTHQLESQRLESQQLDLQSPLTIKRPDIFPFLELPAELRNRIYEEALFHDRASSRISGAGILRTCREVREEANDMLYEKSALELVVTTPKTMWWDPAEEHRTKFASRRLDPWQFVGTLAIYGDLERHLHGKRINKRTIGRFCGGPSIGEMYDLLPRSIIKLQRINISLEPIVDGTVANFLYALACLLNSEDTRTKELNIMVTGDQEGSDESRKYMWYPLAKMPTNLNIKLYGNLGPMHWFRNCRLMDLYVRRQILQDEKPHPLRPVYITSNTVAEIRRIAPIVRPIAEATRVAQFPADISGSWTIEPGNSVMCVCEVDSKLNEIEQRIEHGKVPYNRVGLDVDTDLDIQLDLKLCEEWAQRMTSGTKFDCTDEHVMRKEYIQKQDAVRDEIKRWEDAGCEAIWRP